MKAEIITSVNAMMDIKDNWNKLLEESISDTIFLTWEWMYSWAECFAKDERKLLVICIYDDTNRLMGIAPWYIRPFMFGPFRGSEICFLGLPETGSDYLDVLVNKGQERNVASAIYSLLFETSKIRWDCLRLTDMPAESLFLLNFRTKLQQAGKYFEVTASSFCPLIQLPNSSEEYLSRLPGKRTRRLRQDIRILQRTDQLQHVISAAETLREHLEEFFYLYSEKAQRDGKDLKKILTGFIDLENAEQKVQIDLLKANGILVAGLLHLIYKNTAYLYLMAVDKAYNPKVSLGNVLVGYCINKAIENGTKVYDFLKGAEEYKFYWTSSGRTSANLLCYKRSAVSVLRAVSRFGKDAIKLMTR